MKKPKVNIKLPEDPVKTGKIVLGLVIIIVAIIITWKIYRYFNPKEEKGSEQITANQNKLSYSIDQYSVFADAIQEAMNSSNDDEEAIYNVFKLIKNTDDMAQLINTYGVRKYVSTVGFFHESGNLVRSLHAKLDESEIEDINEILSGNNVNFTV